MAEFSEKQVQIMEAAEKLFADEGFDGTSVRDIAEKSAVNLAMINYYFGSKEKLMEAIFLYRSTDFKLQLENMVKDKNLQPMEKMEYLIDQYIDRLLTQQCFHRLMVREQMVSGNPIISTRILEMKRSNQELVRQLIVEGQKAGVFRKQVDIPLLVGTLIGTVSHMVTTRHYYKVLNNIQSMTEAEYRKHIRKKLSHHLKAIFKAILTHEE